MTLTIIIYMVGVVVAYPIGKRAEKTSYPEYGWTIGHRTQMCFFSIFSIGTIIGILIAYVIKNWNSRKPAKW